MEAQGAPSCGVCLPRPDGSLARPCELGHRFSENDTEPALWKVSNKIRDSVTHMVLFHLIQHFYTIWLRKLSPDPIVTIVIIIGYGECESKPPARKSKNQKL